MFSPSRLIGSVLAFYLLVGRWTVSRISDRVDSQIWLEPRLWAVGLLVALVLLEQSTRRVRAGWRSGVRLGTVVLCSLGFLGYMAFTATWSPDPAMGSDKAYEMGLLGVLMVVLHLCLRGPHGERIRGGVLADDRRGDGRDGAAGLD